jgi:hypothetical protein
MTNHRKLGGLKTTVIMFNLQIHTSARNNSWLHVVSAGAGSCLKSSGLPLRHLPALHGLSMWSLQHGSLRVAVFIIWQPTAVETHAPR